MEKDGEVQTNRSIMEASEMLNSPTKEEKARLAKEKRKKRLLRELDVTSKRGVCYLSRVPPQMDPLKLRQILSKHGEVLRIYLVPEDPTSQVRRKSAGGHRGRQFSEGWVEFAKKSVAKRVVQTLNGEQIVRSNGNANQYREVMRAFEKCGKKRSRFYYDLWSIKYLRGFKWDHLTDEQARKHAEREQKLVVEISAAKKERDFYLAKIDQSRAVSAMQERANKKQILVGSSASDNGDKSQEIKIVRQFSQMPPVSDKATKTGPKLSKDFLAGIFGKSSS